MNRVAARAGITIILVLALLSGLVFFLCEYVSQAGGWVVFPGSPHVYNGGNIGCGVITDADGILLLDMNGGRVYSNSPEIRKSTVHLVGDRNGSVSAPALSAYSAELVGYDLLNGIYSYSGEKGVARLSISGEIQAAALEALGNRKGTVGVYNYKTGQLLCAVTTPTFDPDNVPDLSGDTDGSLEGIFVNRFTQSVYIPGSIFKIVTLAAALETIPDIQQQEFSCTGSYTIGVDTVTCEGAHWSQDVKTAFRNSCNCVFAQIAQQLGGETLQRYAQQFGITESIRFDGISTAKGHFDVADTAEVNVAWGGIGQYTDQVNPCTFMTFVGAIAAGGRGVQPYLVDEITVGSTRSYSANTVTMERIMSASTAKVLQEYMGFNVQDKYGSQNFPDMTVCAKTGTGEVGGGKKPNATIAGFVSDDRYPLAFIVMVEEGGYGSDVCVPILSEVLAACKEYLD